MIPQGRQNRTLAERLELWGRWISESQAIDRADGVAHLIRRLAEHRQCLVGLLAGRAHDLTESTQFDRCEALDLRGFGSLGVGEVLLRDCNGGCDRFQFEVASERSLTASSLATASLSPSACAR